MDVPSHAVYGPGGHLLSVKVASTHGVVTIYDKASTMQGRIGG